MDGLRVGDTIDGVYKVISTEIMEVVQHADTCQEYAIRCGHMYCEFSKEDKILELNNPHTLGAKHHSNKGILKRGGEEEEITYYLTQVYSEEHLSNIITCTSGGIQENIAKYYFLQLCSGLSHMHSKGISHRDVNEYYVRFGQDCNLVLTNYRFASDKFKDRGIGPRHFIPEARDQDTQYFGMPADVWMLANLLREMTLNEMGYDFLVSDRYNMLVQNYPHKWFAQVVEKEWIDYVPEDLQQVLVLMLQPEPALRPSIAELTKHPWVQEGVATKAQVEDWWRYIIWSARDSDYKAKYISDGFPKLIGLKRTRKAEGQRFLINKYDVMSKFKNKHIDFVFKDLESLFSAISGFCEHNDRGTWRIDEHYYKIYVTIIPSNIKTTISISEYEEGTYIAETCLDHVWCESDFWITFLQWCDRLNTYLGPLVVKVLNREKIEEELSKYLQEEREQDKIDQEIQQKMQRSIDRAKQMSEQLEIELSNEQVHTLPPFITKFF